MEVLAPAGSYDSFRTALTAGADAVYAGGPHFGARAYAENFTEEQLLEVIDEAHLHGRRFYLTVNTLVKDQEMPQLYRYLEPLYRGGLDAVIVQDIGVFQVVRTCFPDLDIHASTQMTITGAEGARFLKECGAVRVVPARELSLEEIRQMKHAVGMEMECFVHGALCYCYSGQCLLSSLIGGRSGNRGQCAQPCRLRYASGGKKGYLLSLKDICTLELIPDLIEAGIDSFKIEGRMKRPEYVAGVTSMYRKYVDLYQKSGRQGFRVSEEDQEMLLDLYNRGGFHTGYYQQKNGRDMFASDRPNHAGVPAVKVMDQKGREVTVKALTQIHRGDVLAFPQQGDHTFGKDHEKGSRITIPLPKGKHLEKGLVLNRIRNEKLLEELRDFQKQGKRKEKIYGFLRLYSEEPAMMTVCMGEVSAQAVSEIAVEQAEKSPLDEARIRKQLEKTGNTEFEFDNLEMDLEEGVFLPMQQINELRRRVLEELRKKICMQYHRPDMQSAHQEDRQPDIDRIGTGLLTEKEGSRTGSFQFSALVQTMSQLDQVCAFPEVSRVYIDSAALGMLSAGDALADRCGWLRAQGREVFLGVPHIFREQAVRMWEARMRCFERIHFDGILLRNYEGFALWNGAEEKERLLRAPGQAGNSSRDRKAGGWISGIDRNVILDHNVYVMNQAAKAFWNQQGVREFTVPVELNRNEILHLGAEHMEMLVYGYLPVMVTAQCLAKTVDRCRKQAKPKAEYSGGGNPNENIRELTDRYGNPFLVENRCEDCYNIIYNSVPLCLFDEKAALKEIGPSRLRLQFSVEDGEQTSRILQECIQAFSEGMQKKTAGSHPDFKNDTERGSDPHQSGSRFTRGHFRRGVL